MIHPHIEYHKLQLSRINQLAAVAIAMFMVLLARLWYLQVVCGADLLRQSESNRIKLLRTRAPRGAILDCKGRILATSRPQFVVLVVPEELRSDPDALRLLCQTLQLSPAELEDIVAKNHPRPGSPVRVKIDVPLATVARLGELHMRLPGVSVELDQIRFYPNGPAVGHLMGQLGEINEKELAADRASGGTYRPGDYIGKAGLEKQYERELRGTDGGKEIEVNAAQRVMRIIGEKPSVPGKTLKLGIDRDLQVAAYRAMGNQQGAVVAIDPRSGSVLAMVSKPSYDPNVFVKRVKAADWVKIIGHKGRPLQNRCVYNVYPPGSTFKPVMAIAGLVYNQCSVNTTVSCPGSFYLGRHRFGCWRTHGGGVNFMRALAESCDVWFYNLGHRLEIDRIASVARQFGLGTATGIDLPQESRRTHNRVGTIPDTAWKQRVYHERWWPGETISCSIGQGYVQASPLQMSVMCSAVANGGSVMRPRLVTEIMSGDRTLRRVEPQVTCKVNAPEKYFELVRQGMRQAVTAGTGRVCDVPGIAVAGKTGSAEDPPRPAHGWFICFAPVEKPSIAIACIVEHGRHGTTTAAPVCRAILDVYFGRKKPQEIGSGQVSVSGD
jgi:penicillin-binding protein 2